MRRLVGPATSRKRFEAVMNNALVAFVAGGFSV